MRASMNQPFRGLSVGPEDVYEGTESWIAPDTASPPAVGRGIMDTIIGGIKDVFSGIARPEVIGPILNRTLYGQQPVVPSTMYTPGAPGPGILAPKAAFPTEYLVLGGGALLLLLMTRGKKRGKA